MAMAIDAMDLLHSGRFDGFVIASSDSDFTRLASRIRENGLDVYGFGSQSTNEAFRNACKRFLYVETLGSDDVNVVDEQRDRKSSASDESEQNPPAGTAKILQQTKVVPLVLKAMKSINPEHTWYQLGHVGNVIIRANPDFDSRNYGHAKLSDLLARTGAFEVRRRNGSDTEIRRKP